MELIDLGFDRFLKRNPDQSDSTKNAVYTAINPKPKLGDTSNQKIGQPNRSTEDGGAPNVLTGTVIVSCFIQTSALPSRIEMQGNDLTFFDDTAAKDGKVTGDTSRLIFTHGSGKKANTISQGFIWEKRASTIDSYDNVLSLYALTPAPGRQNYMFFGMQGSKGNHQYHTNIIQFLVNKDPAATTSPGQNGEFNIIGALNGIEPEGAQFTLRENSLLGVPGDGYSIVMGGSGTGLVGIVSPLLVFRAVYITQGAGSPEGVVEAPPGSLYMNTSGGAGATLWVKESGSGNTGWIAK